MSTAIYSNWSSSIHSRSSHSFCSECHYGTANGGHPGTVNTGTVNNTVFTTTVASVNGTLAQGAVFCTYCHTGYYPIPHPTNVNAGVTCVGCHTDPVGQGNATGDAHAIQPLPKCIDCHAVAQAQVAPGLVNDNNGVRNIVAEFGKWSHHVTGATLNDAHCAACHMEGKVSNGAIAVDSTKHMVDGNVHLRDTTGGTDNDFQWDPMAPNHSGMDNFCMSCHDSDGANSPMSAQIQAYINANGIAAPGKTASATNPFGDTISNQYDKLQRPAVVNVYDQMNPANNSHHAVRGPRYSGRTRLAGSRQIASPATFTANSSATLPGTRTTIFDSGKFNQLYTPLANAGGEVSPRTGSATLGDDSTLHCGDCHTVGQWKPGSSTNRDGTPTPVAIGAHGSMNEYLLRNSIGTDARHQGIQMTSLTAFAADNATPYLVCYNCHVIAKYGTAAHVGEQVSESNCNTAVNTNTSNQIGADRLNSQYTANWGSNVAGTSMGIDRSNIYGIQCNNCHNSGISAGNIFGGIHGSVDPTYTDGAGNTTKHFRFLPGLGNVMYVPGTRGGITGGTIAYQSYSSKVQTSGISKNKSLKGTYSYITSGVTNDTNWEEKSRIPVGDGVTNWSHNPGAAGCYTIAAPDEPIVAANAEGNGVPAGPPASVNLTDPNGGPLYGVWGGCTDHAQQTGSSVRQPRSGNTSIRPVTY
jgi:hypothetical protein